VFLELFEDALGVEFGADTEVHFLQPGDEASAWFGFYASTRLDSQRLDTRHSTLTVLPNRTCGHVPKR
jgi:hypothetical protein